MSFDARQDFEAFDKLPPSLREAIRESPIGFDARPFLTALEAGRVNVSGCIDLVKRAEKVGQAEMALNYDGPDHPQAVIREG